MIIEIASDGGFGGLAAAGVQKRIDVDQQTAPVRQELCEAFEPDELQRLAEGANPDGGADRMTYRITVTDETQHRQMFTIREDQLPAGILDLIDQM